MPIANGTIVTQKSTGDLGQIVGFVGNYGVDVYSVQIKQATKKLRVDEFLVQSAEASEWDKAVGLQAVRMGLSEVKIVHPFRETLASYGATKTELHAYQFKPLMKLNRSGLGRILIADEVGLGKTIEAGYIILELIARDPYLSVVVVCPPMLRPKWKAELYQRFALRFDIMTANEAERRIARREDDPSDSPLRAIVAYETIRNEKFFQSLKNSDAARCAVGLVIADEAHRARNRDSTQSRALELLVARAETAVFLTATPIQNKAEDLSRLLEILSPRDFVDHWSFESFQRANEIVVNAETAVSRADPARLAKSIEDFEGAPDNWRYRLIAENPYFEDALARMRSLASSLKSRTLSDPEVVRHRIELQDSLFKLNLLSPILNRTRRKDVHANSAKRKPYAVDAQLTAYEQSVYHELTDAVFQEYAEQHGEGVARFVLKSFQQGFASSLWAAVAHYRERYSVTEADGDLEIEDIAFTDSGSGVPTSLTNDASTEFLELKRVLATIDLDRLWREDSKWKLLRDVLAQHGAVRSSAGHPRKLLIFSYYKRSLDLIGRRLSEMGMRYLRIDGDVSTNILDTARDERQRILKEFRDTPDIQILIASQVGTEGLDLQFCDTVVNWDLPWNPMTIEQRIGRIDRIGQKSEVLHIVNVACRGTVEWEILHRLYHKVGVFKSSIGDLEEILGEVAERLQQQLSRTRLSESEIRDRIDAEAVVLANVKKQQEELEQEANSLITADSFLIDEFERICRTGQCVHPAELERFTCERLKKLDPASKLFERKSTKGLWEFHAGPLLIARAENSWRKTRVVEWKSFLQRMRAGPLPCTFDGAKFENSPEVEVLSVNHPLLRVLVEDLEVHNRECRSFRCAIKSSQFPRGDWVLFVGLVSNPTEERGSRIMSAASRCGTDETLSGELADALLSELLEKAVDYYGEVPELGVLERARAAADRALYTRFESEQAEHGKRSELQAKRRATVLTGHHDRLIEIAQRARDTTRARAAFDRGAQSVLAAQEGRVKAAERAKDIALAQLPKAGQSRLELFEHFIGYVSIQGD
jgi:SNF2 family DNA or RNA helicase